MNEPRGHDVMSGALLTDPCHPEADIGVIYIETGGYLPMCGHDTIGVCTALIESGLIPVVEPITSLDTPAGLVEVDIFVQDGKAKEVSFVTYQLFTETHYCRRRRHWNCRGGYCVWRNFYAIIDAKSVGLELVPENASTIIDKAIHIRNIINEKFEIIHPEHSFIRGLTHVEFYTDPTHESAHVKNTVVVPPGGIDRSPCGTGTSAKLAVLYANQKLRLMKSLFTRVSLALYLKVVS